MSPAAWIVLGLVGSGPLVVVGWVRWRFRAHRMNANADKLLANAEAKLVRDLVRLEKEYEDPPEGPYDALAGRGAVAMMRARLEWIRQVSAELGGKSGR